MWNALLCHAQLCRRRCSVFMIVLLIAAGICAQDSAPRQFSDEPRSGSAEVSGNTKLLFCSADGRPTPSYRWTRDMLDSGGRSSALDSSRQVVEDGSSGTLRIRNVSRANAGRYRCTAYNQFGAVMSRAAVVQVAYLTPSSGPAVIERQVNSGGWIVLDLPPIDCYPAPSVQWFQGSSQIALRNGVSEHYHVTLSNQLVLLASRNDVESKAWRSTVTNPFAQLTVNGPTYIVQVTNADAVQVAPLAIVIGPTDTRAIEDVDEAIKLECVVNASPLTHAIQRWYRLNDAGQTTLISNDNSKYLISFYRRVLTILRPTVADSGVYRCEATYHRPSTASSQDLRVTAEARLSVLVRPTLSAKPPATIDQQVETRLVVPCSAIGTPHPVVTWYRNAEPIVNTTRIFVTDDGSLVIPSTLETDGAIYQCFGVSEAGEVYSVMRLHVFGVAPRFVKIPQNHTVVVGTNVRLECQANGAPTPAITWTRVRSMRGGGVVEAMGSGTELTLPNIAINESGVYSCTAINSKGAVNGYSYIRVTARSRIVNAMAARTLAVAGTVVTLPCGVDFDSHFTVTWKWYRNSSLIAPNQMRSDVTVEPDGSLRLTSVTKADAGLLTCDIDSGGGQDTSSGWLHVIDRPQSPFLMSVSLGSRPRSVEVMWLAVFEDNTYVTRFIVYAQSYVAGSPEDISSPVSAGELIVEKLSASFSLVIESLRPGYVYKFSVTAVNIAGEGLPSLSSTSLLIPEEIPGSPPTEVSATQNSTTAVSSCWMPPDRESWNGKLLGYTVRCLEQQQGNVKLFSINSSDATVQCIEIEDLNIGVVYELSVAGYNSAGMGPFSESVKALIAEGAPQSPAANVTVVAISSTRVEVTFHPPSHKARQSTLGYRVLAHRIASRDSSIQKRSLMEKDYFVAVKGSLVGKSVEKIQVGGLRKFTTYEIAVVCFTNTGDGPPSDPVIIQTMEDVPDQVDSLSAEVTANSSVIVRWTQPLQTNGVIVGYKVFSSIDAAAEEFIDLSPEVQSYTVSVQVGALCTFRVAAMTRKGDGPTKSITLTAGNTVTSTVSTTVTTVPTSTSTSTSTVIPSADKLIAPVTVVRLQTSTVKLATDQIVNVSVAVHSSTFVPPDEPSIDLLSPRAANIEEDAIYQNWWFVLLMALIGVLLVIVLVSLICWTERRQCRRIKRIEGGSTAAAVDAKAEFQLTTEIDENEGFTTIGRRQRWNQSKFPQSGTLPRYTRAPPRPSPGSILYDDVDVNLHQAMTSFRDDDSGHASDRACQDVDDDDSDVYSRLHQQRYSNLHDVSRPRSFYESSGTEPILYQTVTFPSDVQSTHPSTFRPPVLSSFT